MALRKVIRKPNGLVFNYHRIAMVKIDTNQQCTFLVESYLNEEGRELEKAYAAGNIVGEITLPYTLCNYISTDYDANMNIHNAYEWLKIQPEYVGAEDI